VRIQTVLGRWALVAVAACDASSGKLGLFACGETTWKAVSITSIIAKSFVISLIFIRKR
jgi:hypothetical protein